MRSACCPEANPHQRSLRARRRIGARRCDAPRSGRGKARSSVRLRERGCPPSPATSLGDEASLRELLNEALRTGAASDGVITIVNVNRQRPTADSLWDRLVDFVAREELWEPGCEGCPGDGNGATGCPFRANAATLRRPAPRQALRQLVRLGAGEAVPTMREILAILAWAIVGGSSCSIARKTAVLRGMSAHTAADAYFHRVVGGGLRPETIERSPLLQGIAAAGLGQTADLQVDEWLRETTGAPAGHPAARRRASSWRVRPSGRQHIPRMIASLPASVR